jgi:hypothetical protein
MSTSIGECVKTHGIPLGLNAVSGAVAGALCLGAPWPGALCGVVRYVIDLKVPSSGVLGGLSRGWQEIAMHVIKALASLAVLWISGVGFAAPLVLLGFCVLTPAINWALTSLLWARPDQILSRG